MGIEDIQISEELETNAPSIKYRGDEGPKSPQQMQEMMMAQLEEEYLKYVDEMIEMGREPMSMQQFMDQAMAEGQMAGGNPLVSETYVIKSILVTSAATPTVTVTNNSITAIKSAALTANVTTELLTQPLVVEGGDAFTVLSSTTDSFDVAISYLNIKKEVTV